LKIELWYQILAFYEIAGMIYLGAVPLVFENSSHASPDFRIGDGIFLPLPDSLLE
jgi:hypothetical protein